ncbi:hypothetical protein [Alteromonas halophila]|uniref:Uncharacterized protein n=1 Tax=Alteromonas halophila TaxID=516698 RepID=A0A918JMM0_9ALTE|nr:hypothetical protein [Alteromonas halophila]GGW86232.1 hypothetical protein GCM10007391_19870 [Alteromonas halophila]
MLSFTAEVRPHTIDNAVYVLVDNDGTRYEPINLPIAYRVDGTRLEVTATKVTDRASTSQAGMLIKLDNINLLSEGQGKKEGNVY